MLRVTHVTRVNPRVLVRDPHGASETDSTRTGGRSAGEGPESEEKASPRVRG